MRCGWREEAVSDPLLLLSGVASRGAFEPVSAFGE